MKSDGTIALPTHFLRLAFGFHLSRFGTCLVSFLVLFWMQQKYHIVQGGHPVLGELEQAQENISFLGHSGTRKGVEERDQNDYWTGLPLL